MDVGSKILEVLTWSGISQAELARRTKIAPTTINGYVLGKRKVPFKSLEKIAAALNVSIFIFLNGEPLPANYTELTSAERQMLGDFRMLTRNQQEFILQNIALLKKQNSH